MGKHKKRSKHAKSTLVQSQSTDSTHTLADSGVIPAPGPDDSWLLQKAEKLFQKAFTYPPVVSMPDLESADLLDQLFTTPRWQLPKLQKLKEELNDVKNQLSSLEIRQWHAHTSRTHPGSLVIQHYQTSIRAELCTQAWCKFHEILHRFQLMAGDTTRHAECTSVHLCEAPGGFVTSLNHYLNNTGYVRSWHWLAVTLNPYYEGNCLGTMIDEDAFIFETLDNWSFGRDDTGNIMSKLNIQHLCHRAADLKHVTLVTADGSVDCANCPSEQESQTSQLHYTEVVAALHILQPGGDLVIKMFTLFEDSSVGLLYLLRCVFKEVIVFKPVTSKPGNSEVYVVCKGYHGVPQMLLDKLLDYIGTSNSDVCFWPKEEMTTDFLEAHLRCSEEFSRYQTDTISDNLSVFTSPNREADLATTRRLQQLVLWKHTTSYRVQHLDDTLRLPSLHEEW